MTMEQRKKIRQYRLGKKHSPETLLKMSLAKKGKPSSWKGKHPTEETRKRMSEAMKRNPRPHQFKKGRIPSKEEKEKRLKTMAGKYKGENAFNWKGGLPHCQDCGKLLGARRFSPNTSTNAPPGANPVESVCGLQSHISSLAVTVALALADPQAPFPAVQRAKPCIVPVAFRLKYPPEGILKAVVEAFVTVNKVLPVLSKTKFELPPNAELSLN